MSHWVELWHNLRFRGGKDSRREPRVPARNTILVCGLDATGRFFAEENSTVNVSSSGCCFRTAAHPMADTVVSIKPRNKPAKGVASAGLYQVIWTRDDAGSVLVGAGRIDFEHE